VPVGPVSIYEGFKHGYNSPWEEGSVHDVDILGTIDLSVGVNDAGSASQTTVSSNLRCADPMVGTALGGGKRQLRSKLAMLAL